MTVRVLLLLFLYTTVSAGLLEFTQHPESQEVTIGSAVTLQCDVSSGMVTGWLYNNNPLSEDGDIDINGNVLMISSYQTHLAGDYRCVASGSDGSGPQVSHFATLTHFALRTFAVHPQDFTVYLASATFRETAVFQCEFKALYYGIRPNITWEINNGGTISTVELEGRYVPFQYDHTGYLQIHFPVEADNGTQVRCVATDPSGSPDDPVVKSNWASVVISGDVRPVDLPVFSMEPPQPTVHFIEGQDLVLGCAKTIPDFSVGLGWYLGSSQIFIQGTSQTLLPSQVEVYGRTNIKLVPGFNHTGIIYSCRVTVNEMFNFIERSTTVVPPPPPPSINITDQSEDKILMYGEREEFQVVDYVGAIQWWYSGAPIEGGDGVYSSNTTSNSLTLLSLDLNSGGVYQAELLDLSPPQFVNFDATVQADECTLGLHDCDPNAECSDTTDSFTCTCNSGFDRDGKTCTDIDECASGTANCHPSASCQNTEGNFNCTCNSGFVGDGKTCTDVDECAMDTSNCHPNATCQNTEGGFNCTCNSGFVGDGKTCTDICELAYDPGPCEAYQPHYYHNATSGQCEEFVYGGCEGNANRFATESECAQACNVTAGRRRSGRGGLEDWEIALIVLLLWVLLVLCLCFICCCLIVCWKRRRRHYYPEEKEMKYQKEMESYRVMHGKR